MKKNIVFSHIRKTSLKHLAIFIIPLVYLIVLLFIIPFDEVFFSESTDNGGDAVLECERGKTYITIKPDKIYYTGYDVMAEDKCKNSYYYEIIDNRQCVFFLLENDGSEKSISYSGKKMLVRFEEADNLFDSMLSSLANDIGWNYEELENITSKVVLRQIDGRVWMYYVVFAVLVVNIVYLTYIVVHNLLCVIFPVLHQSIRKVKRFYGYSSYKKLSEDLDRQMLNESVSAGGMHITDGFFIHLGSFYINIVPLSEILFVYKNSQLKNFVGLHFKILYTLHVRGNKKFRCACPGKSKEDTDCILDYFNENYPDILNGYTDDNRKMAIKNYKEMKKERRLKKKKSK